MSDDTDLRGMGAAEARAYVLEFLTSFKTRERELSTIAEELALWGKRVELAAQKGATELEAAARAKVTELDAKRETLSVEKAELAAKIARMRERLPIIAATEHSVDADLLLAEMQIVTGEALGGPSAAVEQGLASLGAEDALAALKRKLTGTEPPKD
ncbi:MAG: hypothetical protein E4H20_05105 [Spirochaetales bacterium]|nr:MAG: hypothetical protein E4H20_05105 [Spirochaetales bacterium]